MRPQIMLNNPVGTICSAFQPGLPLPKLGDKNPIISQTFFQNDFWF